MQEGFQAYHLMRLGRYTSDLSFSVPRRPLLIFDWDDTLCPTSWLKSQAVILTEPGPLHLRPQLSQITQSCISLLRSACNHGDVFLSTNAAPGWVNTASKNFMYGVAGEIDRLNIPVLYGREHCQSNCSLRWKESAASKILDSLSYIPSTVMSFGDQALDHEAVTRVLCRSRPPRETNPISTMKKLRTRHENSDLICPIKCVKFLHEPDIDELVLQIETVRTTLKRLVDSRCEGNLAVLNTLTSRQRIIYLGLRFKASERGPFTSS